MQPKINTFFKRQATGPDSNSEATVAKKPKSCGDGGKVLNKKRNYGQFHLELGQPDFLLHMCAVCGMMYARGNDEDEKVHRAYHRSYSEGVSFKGWREETVVMKFGGGDRIILASGDKSCMRNSKVQEVIRVVEKELGYGEDQLVHKLCKVYLFVSGGRIVGCLVAEPIKAAHKVIPSSSSESRSNLPDSKRESAEANHTLEFGKISFKREVLRRNNHPDKNKEECQGPGAIVCEEEAVPALCGFRAIWVVPLRRRKGIASQLVDAARKSFCKDRVLGISQCAFTPPTSAGKELASSYYKTSAFLVYRDGDV